MDKAVIEEILQPGNEKTQKSRAQRVRTQFWATLRKAAGRIPFMEEVVAAYFCAFDPTTPRRVRATLLAALAYFVMPLDMIPDIMAVIGFTDDIAVLSIALAAVRSHIKPEHRQAARDAMGKQL